MCYSAARLKVGIICILEWLQAGLEFVAFFFSFRLQRCHYTWLGSSHFLQEKRTHKNHITQESQHQVRDRGRERCFYVQHSLLTIRPEPSVVDYLIAECFSSATTLSYLFPLLSSHTHRVKHQHKQLWAHRDSKPQIYYLCIFPLRGKVSLLRQ